MQAGHAERHGAVVAEDEGHGQLGIVAAGASAGHIVLNETTEASIGTGADVRALGLRPAFSTNTGTFTTGYSLDGAVQEILGEGMEGFIQKPFRLDQLAGAVSHAMQRAS